MADPREVVRVLEHRM
jgi:Ca2+-binding EF-hand superfamily protein